MFKQLKTIMFATNLDDNCRAAFDIAASMAIRYQATLVLLHVLEELPSNINGRLKGLIGDEAWADITKHHADDARDVLIGKRSTSKLIQKALGQFCINAGIDDSGCDYHSREIVVTDGILVDEIVNQAVKYKSDLIIMGSREGLVSEIHIGSTIKSVMRRSHIPVMVVPPN
jgi:nucleotide-binding universal stress UspA family protein